MKCFYYTAWQRKCKYKSDKKMKIHTRDNCIGRGKLWALVYRMTTMNLNFWKIGTDVFMSELDRILLKNKRNGAIFYIIE